jgi:hypothetical protein
MYARGKKDYFDYLDPDEISLIELVTMVKKLGYSEKTPIWCRIRGQKQINPKLLRSDQELMEMINKLGKKNKIMECFLDHSEYKGFPTVASVNLENNNSDEGANFIKNVMDQDHGDDSEEDSDFYDFNNDITADDNDLNFELNV